MSDVRRRRLGVSRLLVKVGTWHKSCLKSCRRFKFRSCGSGNLLKASSESRVCMPPGNTRRPCALAGRGRAQHRGTVTASVTGRSQSHGPWDGPGPACAGAVRPPGPYGCGGSKNTLTALINQYINAAASAIVVRCPASARAGPRRINQNVDIEALNVDIRICF